MAGSYEITGDKERAQEVIDNSLDDIDGLCFDNISTFRFLLPDREYFFDNPIETMKKNSEKYLDTIEKNRHDCLRIELSGKNILEVTGNGKQ